MPRSTSLAAVVACCCLVALAGCIGTPDGTGTPTEGSTPAAEGTATADDTVTDATATATVRAASTATATATPQTTDDGTASRPQVQLRDANGTELGTVTVSVSDTSDERYTGLSDTERLNESEGMLFVYESSGRRAYVMRDMAFPLDILFVAADGTITTIHHAPTEPGVSNENLTRYPGEGQYVLEVNRGYTNRTGVTVGDTVAIPAAVATAAATPNTGDGT